MKKSFNVTGLCISEKHYMVDLTDRISQIRKMVDAGDYFTINCARQYGKTTTLTALAKALDQDYFVVSLDFQVLGSAAFQNENAFSLAFLKIFLREMKRQENKIIGMEELIAEIQEAFQRRDGRFDLLALFEYLLSVCGDSEKALVLMIDEVDSASNHQVFLDFLAQLRSYYLERDTKGTKTFHSVILAGVYDVKKLKRKLRSEDEHKRTSPWNIAADFDVEMSLSEQGIAGMLREYEEECHTGMDIEELAGLLYHYTSGYPYLVSRLCKLMDEKICSTDIWKQSSDRGKASAAVAEKYSTEISGHSQNVWTKNSFLEAVRMLLSENNMLFESLIGKLSDYPELNRMLRELLFLGKSITYSPTNSAINLASMFGFIKNESGKAVPANRIFDTLLYNHFLSEDEIHSLEIYKASLQDKNQFIEGKRLKMRRILEKFVQHFHELYGNRKESFAEEGRRYFLLYLRPIINGVGNYYVEARTRSLGRTDIIVDYCGEQFVIETKIWRGNEYNTRGENQLAGYLDDYGLDQGYMLSFCFNKKKQIGVHEVIAKGKVIIEAVV